MGTKRDVNEYIGDTSINLQGYSMTIVDARNTHDIDVMFDDNYNTVYQHKKLTDFYRGKIKNPNYLLGLENIAFNGQKIRIVGGDATNLDIEFEDGTIVHNIRKENFDLGTVKNLNYRNIYGIGYIGYGKYNASEDNGKTGTIYSKWHGMFNRCYSPLFHAQEPTYRNCEVDESFHCLQDFGKWYEENVWDNNTIFHIEKDILKKGNKLYSKDNCILTDRRINNLFISSQTYRGKYPIGVYEKNGKFDACCSILKKQKWLGSYPTPEEAFNSYKQFKESYIKQVADEYKSKYPNFPQKLYDAMYSYEVEITD